MSVLGGLVTALGNLVLGDADDKNTNDSSSRNGGSTSSSRGVFGLGRLWGQSSPPRPHGPPGMTDPGTCGNAQCRSRRRCPSDHLRETENSFSASLAKDLSDEWHCPVCTELLVTPFDFQCGHHLCGQCLVELVEHHANRAPPNEYDLDLMEDEARFIAELQLPVCPSCRAQLMSMPKPATKAAQNTIDNLARVNLSSEEQKSRAERLEEERENEMIDRLDQLLGDKIDRIIERQARERRRARSRERHRPGDADRDLSPDRFSDDDEYFLDGARRRSLSRSASPVHPVRLDLDIGIPNRLNYQEEAELREQLRQIEDMERREAAEEQRRRDEAEQQRRREEEERQRRNEERIREAERNAEAANLIQERLHREFDDKKPSWEYDKSGRATCRLCSNKIEHLSLRVKCSRPVQYFHAECAINTYRGFFQEKGSELPGFGRLNDGDKGMILAL